jgi:hypothetical protein
MRMRSRSLVAEPVDLQPPELEARVAALEHESGQGRDFDAVSWCWLLLLGVLLPAVLLLLGWWA